MRKAQLDKHYPYALQKVVIADDHAIFRHGLKTLLLKYPFIKLVGEASNGRSLIRLVATEKPTMVFTDLHMPDSHGMEAVKEIREFYPKVKVVVLSFYNDALTVERMLKLGVNAYLSKNITIPLMDKMFAAVFKDKVYTCPDAANNLLNHKIQSTSLGGKAPKPDNWLGEDITAREKQVLKGMMEGKTYKQIGISLGLSTRTVETHKYKLLKKLGAASTAELIAVAYEYKLV